MSDKRGKLRWSFLLVDLARETKEVAQVMDFGAEKYERKGYMQVPKQKYIDALYRHVQAWASGEVRDPESGLHHLAHAAANCLILMRREG